MNQATLDEITALEQENDGQRKRIKEQAAEIAALRRELSDLRARMLCAVNALTASGSDKLEEGR